MSQLQANKGLGGYGPENAIYGYHMYNHDNA